MITTIPIVQHDFPSWEYVQETSDKTQVTLHHTVSGPNAKGVIYWWKSDEGKKRIATCIIIDRKGVPHQLYSSKYWGYHLGVKSSTFRAYGLPYKVLDRLAIGIELCSWGGLVYDEEDGQFYNAYAGEVSENDVIELAEPYRGYKYYQKYTEEQIQTTKELLLFWNKRYGIPVAYREDMWDFTVDALKGVPGIYSHTSYRTDKSDLFPQKEMINMLKSLA